MPTTLTPALWLCAGARCWGLEGLNDYSTDLQPVAVDAERVLDLQHRHAGQQRRAQPVALLVHHLVRLTREVGALHSSFPKQHNGPYGGAAAMSTNACSLCIVQFISYRILFIQYLNAQVERLEGYDEVMGCWRKTLSCEASEGI